MTIFLLYQVLEKKVKKNILKELIYLGDTYLLNNLEIHERKNKPYKSLIRTYKNHHLAGETILQPASTDITYDVNFSSVGSSLSELDYEVKLFSQKEFLELHGFKSSYKLITEP